MTDLRQAAQQALEALIDAANVLSAPMFADAAAALRTALEQKAEPVCPECKAKVLYECVACSSNNYPPPQQAEPVAWMFQHDETGRMNYVGNDGIHNPTTFIEMNPRYALVCPLYTTPPQRPWVGLTNEDWEQIHDKKDTALDTFQQGAVWAADQLKERNK